MLSKGGIIIGIGIRIIPIRTPGHGDARAAKVDFIVPESHVWEPKEHCEMPY